MDLLFKSKILHYQNHPIASKIIKMINNPKSIKNPHIRNYILGEINIKELQNQYENGVSIKEISSFIEDDSTFTQVLPELYIPVFGHFFKESSPLLKYTSYNKETIIFSDGPFFINNDFINCSSIKDCISKKFPKCSKKTFSLISEKMIQKNYLNFDYIQNLFYLQNLLSNVDDINEVINSSIFFDLKNIVLLDYLFASIDEKRLKKIIINETTKTSSKQKINDIQNLYNELQKVFNNNFIIDWKNIYSVDKLHEYLLNLFLTISSRDKNDYSLMGEIQFPFLNNLSKEYFDNLKIVIPKRKSDLEEWGRTLGNCIATYAHNFRIADVILLGLFQDDKLKYTLEISTNGKIKQFVDKTNTNIDGNTIANFQQLVNKHFDGVINKIVTNQIIKNDTPLNQLINDTKNKYQIDFNYPTKESDILFVKKVPFLKDSLNLILEDSNCQNSFLNDIDYSFISFGFLKFNENQNNSKLNEINDILGQIKQSKEQIVLINLDKITYKKNNIPISVPENVFSDFINELTNSKKCILIFKNKIKKEKNLNYKFKDILDNISTNIIFSYKNSKIDFNIYSEILKSFDKCIKIKHL